VNELQIQGGIKCCSKGVRGLATINLRPQYFEARAGPPQATPKALRWPVAERTLGRVDIDTC